MSAKREDNLEKEKLLAEIERLKKELKKRKKYGLVWEDKPEDVVEMCKQKLPILLVKVYGLARRIPPQLEVTICDFKFTNS